MTIPQHKAAWSTDDFNALAAAVAAGGSNPDNVTLDTGGSGGTLEIKAGGVGEAQIGLADVTTGNVDTTKHGFAPKAPNNSALFLDGTGAWSAPSVQGPDTRAVALVAHGFVVGDVLRYNGTTWVKAKADAAANADVDAIVYSVTDANDFVIALPGSDITGLAGLTGGLDYFLSAATAGALTSTEPSTPGQVSVPVVKAISSTEVLFAPKRGLVIPAASVQYFTLKLVDDSTSITTGESKVGFPIPALLNGKSLAYVFAGATVAATGSGLSFGVRKNAATEMLSTNVTVDTTKTTSDQSATPPVIKSDGSQTVATGDIVWVDCDQADSNAVSRGSTVILGFS